ncbi:small ribosomal subunit protein mS27-like [Saccostrea echinata]|uniref:small ribosomal subunit protein mS27-like n=1 Tax=Saccostrea echinata TaxID=191078 RepID=UPI002A806E1A|nr:small ribosomal subunit protein mS27-like [Saccostrea echinata]
MWRHCRQSLVLCNACNRFKHVSQRHFLSREYAMQDTWENRWPSTVENVPFGRLSVKMVENFEKFGRSSLIDMEMFVNSLKNISPENMELVEDIMYRFRHSDDAYPVRDSIVNAIVRSYIDLDIAQRLVPLIKDKLGYGLLLDFYTANLLMSHFLQKNLIQEAAEVAYEMMFQEDTSHALTNCLSLYCCIKRLQDIADIQPEEDPVLTAEDEEWVRVKIVHRPVYDDHFDIQKEHFRLGKSLHFLGKANVICDENSSKKDLISQSLQFVGLGLYNKFNKALDLLESWIAEGKTTKAPVLCQSQIETFRNHLDWSPTRDPEEEELDLGQQTIEYQARKLYLTEEEKAACIERFEKLVEELKSFDGITDDDIYTYILNNIKGQIPDLQKQDIDTQKQKYQIWKTEMADLYKKEMREEERRRKQEEIQVKMAELAEKEELILSHERKRQILLARHRVPKERVLKKKVELDEDELEDRMKASRALIKKKK